MKNRAEGTANPKSKRRSEAPQTTQNPKSELVVLRDDRRIARYKRISQVASLAGFLFLIAGMILAFVAGDNPNLLLYQTTALLGGWTLSQAGLYLAHRYARSPRPDEVLDEALRKAVRDGRLYHYLLPAPHVLLTPAGPIVFVAKYQSGHISADGDRWKQTGVGLRRIFGQEALGNPAREAESMIKALARYIHENAPNLDEVPIAAMIVFTSKNLKSLDVGRSRIPAMHHTKVRGFLKQKGQGQSLPREQQEALQTAFNKAAAHLLGED